MAHVLGLDVVHSYEEVASCLKNFFTVVYQTFFKKKKKKQPNPKHLNHILFERLVEKMSSFYIIV